MFEMKNVQLQEDTLVFVLEALINYSIFII